ncbi:arrestin domain-containing protein 3-like [Conger conger]|uniref:arrestin domain-containing protein 3-like n=1 Tax=Conger conger TaxID=82655 RepID=UPI002A5AA8B4|nr:arrestin domain-containing protein 3-like [Conger conger]
MTKISLNYDAINEDNVFSSGDFITGRIILELSKEIKINSLSIKAKGEADVRWTEGTGEDESTYSAHERYFKLKHFFIHNDKGKGKDGELLLTGQSGETYPNVVAPGTHVYPFTIQIPHRDMPSSFKGAHGKVLYSLEAKLSRSMRLGKTANTNFTFLSKTDKIIPPLMEPCSGYVEKKMKLFTSGRVSLRVNIDKAVYTQGEMLQIVAEIENNSSRVVKPKFALHQKLIFKANKNTNEASKRIFKVVGENVPSSTRQSVIKTLRIPANLMPTLFHCGIIQVQYTLQVYLDVPFARDPTVIILLTILPKTIGFEQVTRPSMKMGFESHGNNGQAGWNSYPPATALGGYPPQTVPAGYPPQNASRGYAPQSASGGYPPQSASGGYPPQSASGRYPPQSASGGYPPQSASGGYPPQSASGGYPPQSASGGYPPQSASGGYPCQTAFGGHPPQYAP